MSARAVLAAAVAEAEDPKSVFRQVTRAVWIGGGLWILMPNRMLKHQLGHVFFWYERPESQGQVYREAAQGDNKWHMRDVLGEPNSVTCQQAFDTEEEAKAALVELMKRKGLIHSDPIAYRESMEDPKRFLRKIARMPDEQTRSWVIGQVDAMPVWDAGDGDEPPAWWVVEANATMERICDMFYRVYGVYVPEELRKNWTSWLNFDPVEAGNTMVDEMEHYVQQEAGRDRDREAE